MQTLSYSDRLQTLSYSDNLCGIQSALLPDHPLLYTLACIKQVASLQKACNIASSDALHNICISTYQQLATTSLPSYDMHACHVADNVQRVSTTRHGQASEVRTVNDKGHKKEAVCLNMAT